MSRAYGRLVLVVCLVVFLVGVVPAEAGDVLHRIVKKDEFRVGMSGTQPPFSVKSKAGTLIGYEVDLANILADAMGVKLVIVEKPFGQLMETLAKGEVDAVMSGMTMTPERNLKAAFVGPYIISGKSILTTSRELAAAADAEAVNDASLTLVALENSTSQKFVELLMPEAKLATTEDYDQAVRMVIDKRANAMVADFPICVLSVLRHPEAGLATLTQPLSIEPIGIALSPGDSLLLNMVENYLGALEAMGILEELEKKWFDDASWLIQVP
jgi:polar amino acid transport system substrate-binding protein